MTSLNLDERVEPDPPARQPQRVTIVQLPITEWANVVYKLGLPVVLVLWLVWFMTSGIAADLRGMNKDHADIRADHQIIGIYLRAICKKLPQQPGTVDYCDVDVRALQGGSRD
jgi:hypothetical protein